MGRVPFITREPMTNLKIQDVRPTFNESQKAMLRAYANGTFTHLLAAKDRVELGNLTYGSGDSLLPFLIIELSTAEGVETADQAVSRIETVISDLTTVLDALRTTPKAA